MIRLMALTAFLVLSASVISAESGPSLTSTQNTVIQTATTTLQTESTKTYDDRDDWSSGTNSGESYDSWDSSNSGSGSYTSGSSGSGSGTSGLSTTGTVSTVTSATEPVSTETTVVVSTVTPVQPNDAAPRILREESVADDNSGSNSGEGSDTYEWRQPPTQPAPAPTTQISGTTQGSSADLSNVGKSLREFSREARIIETAVQTSVTEEIDRAIQKVRITSRTFDAVERERKLEELKKKLMRRQEALSKEVQTAIASGHGKAELENLQPVLRSSLADIELLIEAEAGVDIDLSRSERTLSEVVTDRSQSFNAARTQLLERDGLDLYTDTDKDGVSDYDEVKVYRTDPHNAYTAGSSLTDGERILLGFDVHSTTTGRVAVESPKSAGDVVEGVFEVYAIDVEAASEEGPGEKVVFAGRALPNSFVTLYIFSTPVVVTVKADASGAWTYTLESELEDGSHELHVATVDDSGRILAKSPVIPFVKVAEAAEFSPLIVPTTPEIDPLDILQSNLLLLVGIVLFLFALAALVILGMRKPENPLP